MSLLPIEAVNSFDAAVFAARFGDVAEDSPLGFRSCLRGAAFIDREAMVDAFAVAVRAHPDLAGRAAVAGDIAAESRREQAGAGLDRLTAGEFARFQDLIARYRERFGFPFILAVKGATKHAILAAFEARIGNDAETERATALANVEPHRQVPHRRPSRTVNVAHDGR